MSKEEALCVYVLTGLLIAGSIALLWVNRPARPPEGASAAAPTGPVSSTSRNASPATGARVPPVDAGDSAPGAQSDPGHPAGGTPGAASQVVVHVSGAVKRPGVYQLKRGDRVVDALQAAGGPSADAAADAVNLALKVEDGQRVYIPSKKDIQAGLTSPQPWLPGGAGGGQYGQPATVNINIAGKEQLEALPGIGPGLAAAIIDYRQRSGGFRKIEDLMKVGGIGPKTFARLKPLVTVN